MVSLPQQPQCDNQQQHVERKKKGHVSLQNILPAHRSGNIQERGSREEHKVFLHERQRIPTRACWLAAKPHTSLSPAMGGSQQAQRWAVYLWHRESKRTSFLWPQSVFDFAAAWACFDTLSYCWTPVTNGWCARLRAASCLKSAWYPTQTVNKVPDSYPFAHLQIPLLLRTQITLSQHDFLT